MKNFNIRSLGFAMFVACCSMFVAQAQGDDDVPPNPEYGKCYAK